MTTKLLTLALVGFLAATLFLSCNKPHREVENAKKEVMQAEQDLQKSEAEYATEVTDFKRISEEKIDQNKKTIKELKEKRSVKKTQAEKNLYDDRIAELERRNDILRDRLRDYKEERKTEKWESFKREFNHDMDELGTSISNIFRDNEK